MPNKKKKGFLRCSSSKLFHCVPDEAHELECCEKQWTEELTLNSVVTQGLSGNRAADLHGVPPPYHTKGLIKWESGPWFKKPESRPYMSPNEAATCFRF